MSAASSPAAPPRSHRAIRLFLGIVCFLAGAAIMVIEISAFRLLAPYFGNTVFTSTALIGVILSHSVSAAISAAGDELESLSSRADADDVVILYLSGHGLDGAYVPSDFDGSNHQLPYSTILDELDRSLARHKLFITDACHSGSMIAAARTPLTVAIQNFYNAYNTANGGTAIMTSSKQEEVSLEYGGLRQGVFSHFLIKGLKGYADSSGDKLLAIEELYQYIYNNVREYTANKQNPSIIGAFDRNMPVGWVR